MGRGREIVVEMVEEHACRAALELSNLIWLPGMAGTRRFGARGANAAAAGRPKRGGTRAHGGTGAAKTEGGSAASAGCASACCASAKRPELTSVLCVQVPYTGGSGPIAPFLLRAKSVTVRAQFSWLDTQAFHRAVVLSGHARVAALALSMCAFPHDQPSCV
eukprot:3078384-Rhodomonas_salina.2